jgi:hypothetical protein
VRSSKNFGEFFVTQSRNLGGFSEEAATCTQELFFSARRSLCGRFCSQAGWIFSATGDSASPGAALSEKNQPTAVHCKFAAILGGAKSLSAGSL